MLSNYALDTFLSPRLSELTECNAEDLSHTQEEWACWIPDFALNTIFRIPIADDMRSYAICFLRKAEATHRAYNRARESLLNWVSRRSTREHAIALSEFEGMLANMDQAFCVLARAVGEKKDFEKGNDSARERLRELYNASKHSDRRIKPGTAPSRFVSPVWVTNEGLASKRARLTFGEIAEGLEELRKFARSFSNPPTPSDRDAAEVRDN